MEDWNKYIRQSQQQIPYARVDGTLKGKGFLGELKRPDGKVSTELSIGVNLDGKETLIPSLVPTLNKDEINYLLSGGKATKEIVRKAVEHAKGRIAEGKSPFAEKGEQPTQGQYTVGKPYAHIIEGNNKIIIDNEATYKEMQNKGMLKGKKIEILGTGDNFSSEESQIPIDPFAEYVRPTQTIQTLPIREQQAIAG